MKPESESWPELFQRARGDLPPAGDLPALLQTLRVAAPSPLSSGWRSEFERVFVNRPALAGCAAMAVALLSLAGWQAWSFWQEVVPWAQLLAGGLS